MLALALLLDAIFGEPDWLWHRVPHPVILFGRAVDALEARLNRSPGRKAKGVVALVLLILVVGLPAWLIGWMFPGGIVEIVIVAILLASSSLIRHIRAVATALRRSLSDGRHSVAMVVGRDPEILDESGVSRAAIESAAENFSDGIVAPAFWYLVAGLPGIVIYKAVNTADSMIGHRSERYREFGWAAARFDDLLNLIPARLSGLLLCAVGGKRASFGIMWRDARKHKSPNAGWPEAATAASLGIALAGPRIYKGVLTDDPFINPEGRHTLTPHHIDATCDLLWRGWAGLFLAALGGWVLVEGAGLGAILFGAR